MVGRYDIGPISLVSNGGFYLLSSLPKQAVCYLDCYAAELLTIPAYTLHHPRTAPAAWQNAGCFLKAQQLHALER